MAMSRNRIVTDTFEPGSIFKIITLAAALDSGAVTMDSTFECSGSLRFRTESIKCWKRGGHGHQTLAEACENSCNCAFMQMALAMGVDTFYDYIYAFGFGSETDSGVPGEDTGDVIHRKYIRDTDLARIGFGQSITVTPLQMVNAASAAINCGSRTSSTPSPRARRMDRRLSSSTTNPRRSGASSSPKPPKRFASSCNRSSITAAVPMRRSPAIRSAAKPAPHRNTMRTARCRARS